MPTDEGDRRLAAPGELELVRDFINTCDLGRKTDRIDEPGRLAAWLLEQGLVPVAPELTERDVRRAQDLREALRALLGVNAGFPPAPGAVEKFNAAAAPARLRIRADEPGGLALLPAEAGLDHAVGRLLSIVVAAQENGTWTRMKACAECRWALYDRTRNRSATWCDPARCGARVRARRYRRRRREASA
jgi:predicted RNA-binding Zn ribbon-like protein